MAIAGAPDYTVKNLGRWSSLAYQLYTRPSSEEFRSASLRMAALPSVKQKSILSPAAYGGMKLSSLLQADVEDVHMILSKK